MKFEQAMALMRAGKKVRRKVWASGITSDHLFRFSCDDIFAEDWEKVAERKPVKAEIEWVPADAAGRDVWSLFAWSDGVVTTGRERIDAMLGAAHITYVAKLRHPSQV